MCDGAINEEQESTPKTPFTPKSPLEKLLEIEPMPQLSHRPHNVGSDLKLFTNSLEA